MVYAFTERYTVSHTARYTATNIRQNATRIMGSNGIQALMTYVSEYTRNSEVKWHSIDFPRGQCSIWLKTDAPACTKARIYVDTMAIRMSPPSRPRATPLFSIQKKILTNLKMKKH